MAALPYGAQNAPQKPPAKPGAPAVVAPEKLPATSAIRGRVTTYPDGRPLARARVMLTRPDKNYAWVRLTDDDGRYEITELEAFDNYMLSASKTGFTPRVWGEQQLPALPTPLKLGPAQTLERIDVALAAHLWISGKVLDSDGTPFGGAVVAALKPVVVGEAREMVPAAEIITNDKGEYRLFGLPPGQYFITATDPAFMSAGDNQGPLVYGPTFYPGVASAEDATRLTLEPGQPRDNIDFKLVIVTPVRVTGKVAAASNEQLVSGAVVMSPYRTDRPTSFSLTKVDLQPDGSYQFFNVPPGRFIIRSRGEVDRDGISLFGSFTLNVGPRNIGNVDMTLLPGARIEGLIEWDGRAPRPVDTSDVRVRAPMADGSLYGDSLTGGIRGDSFVIRGAMAGRHFLRVENLPSPWTLKAVYYRGQDVTDLPMTFQSGEQVSGVRLVLTDRSTTLDGRIISTEGDDMESYKVVAFPANQLYWRPASRHIRMTLPDRDGRFQLRGLPPDLYYLSAARDVDEGDIVQQSTLDRLLASAVTVRLHEGQPAIADIRVRPARRQGGAAAR